MHLRNNYTLCTVYNESTIFCHQWNIAHINVLFFNVMNFFCPCFFINIINYQTKSSFYWSCICQVTLNTFINVIFWLCKFILHKFQNAVSSKITNRENRFEHFFQTKFTSIAIHINVVDKAIIRTGLNLN